MSDSPITTKRNPSSDISDLSSLTIHEVAAASQNSDSFDSLTFGADLRRSVVTAPLAAERPSFNSVLHSDGGRVDIISFTSEGDHLITVTREQRAEGAEAEVGGGVPAVDTAFRLWQAPNHAANSPEFRAVLNVVGQNAAVVPSPNRKVWAIGTDDIDDNIVGIYSVRGSGKGTSVECMDSIVLEPNERVLRVKFNDEGDMLTIESNRGTVRSVGITPEGKTVPVARQRAA